MLSIIRPSLFLGSALLLLVPFSTLLAPVVEANIISFPAWSDLKSTALSSYNGQKQPFETYNTLPDFWKRAVKLGSSVQKYTDNILADATTSYSAAAEKIIDFKQSMVKVVSGAGELRHEFESKIWAHGMTLSEISDMLSKELAVVVDELKTEFPPPDHAEHHEERSVMISRALEKVEDVVVRISVRAGVDEANARAHLRNIEPHLNHVLTVTGDLAEQHPVLLETLLFSGAILLIPEISILRPILNVFGFGPSGPIKGSPAAWAQRRFWGAAVAEGSWFARLQAAGIKTPSWKAIWGSIGVGLGIGGGILGCGRA